MSDQKQSLQQALTKIEEMIAAQEAFRGTLEDALVDAAIAPLRQKKRAILVQLESSGSIEVSESAVRGSVVTGEVEAGGDFVGGDKKQITVIMQDGAKAVFVDNQDDVLLQGLDRESALGKYLTHVIAHNRYLQLQGIRSGGRLVHIELEHIYITLRTTQKRTVTAEASWLRHEAALAPGEMRKRPGHKQQTETITETVTVRVNKAMADHSRLVVLGDPGSGKTTLLRFLALIYARDMAEQNDLVAQKLSLSESGFLPILLPLRQIGAFLQKHGDESVEGHAQLLEFLHKHLQGERITLPQGFFDAYLNSGKAVILLDGMDEVAGIDLRRRVARLVNSFTRAYPDCRFVVTSRIVGYTGSARLSEGYKTTTVQDFNLEEVERFLSYWHRLAAAGQMGAGESAEQFAAAQTEQLMAAIRDNERIRELAINPLMLTVIALVHRDRVKLPDRRAELYAEAVDVLLGKWDEAKNVKELPILENKPFDTGDKRLMLQTIALHMHKSQLKEIDDHALRQLLFEQFKGMVPDNRAAGKTVDRFLHVIRERTGLLVARGDGIYAFSHLTFQEYLAALAVAARDDYVRFTLNYTGDSWWREVVLLEAGHLSMLSKERTTKLIRAISNKKREATPFHNLILASECLRDVGSSRVESDIGTEIPRRLRAGLETPPPLVAKWIRRKMLATGWIKMRSEVVNAMVRAGTGYWTSPYGEPEWIEIPAGAFTMGDNGGREDAKPAHSPSLARFLIARVPVTNAQYLLFVKEAGHQPPAHWEEQLIPKGFESHPVVNVTWHDAMAYCAWLSQMTGKNIHLPSEAEWEKAARGNQDARAYPWGNTFDRLRCNSKALGVGDTTPVGIFPDGASPYGVLDMAGNVWEWTRSLYQAYDRDKWQNESKLEWTSALYGYPYDANDGREDVTKGDEWARVVRGGSWYDDETWLGCAVRDRSSPDGWDDGSGFRVCVSPFSLPSDL